MSHVRASRAGRAQNTVWRARELALGPDERALDARDIPSHSTCFAAPTRRAMLVWNSTNIFAGSGYFAIAITHKPHDSADMEGSRSQ